VAGVTKRVIGYCTPWSAAPGERVDFKVSLEEAETFTASLWRIVCGDDSPDGPGLDLRPVPSAIEGRHAGRRQPLRTGSFVRLPADAALDRARSFSLGLLLWPTAPHHGRAQAVASTWDEARGSGFELGIDAAGHLELRIGSGERASVLRSPRPLAPRCWVRVHATYDDRTGALSLACTSLPNAAWPARKARVVLSAGPGAHSPSGRPFTLAGRPGDDFAERCYDGKLESPCLSDRCLGEMELERLAAAALAGEPPPDLLGCWDFAQDITGVMVRDVSGRGWHGETRNLPARGVAGHAWNGEQHDWRQAPAHYRAIHFHSDDLYDAGWETTLSLAIPADLPSGCYALRLESEGDVSYVTFFVRPPRDRATAPVAFLASTATYMAYANYRFMLDQPLSELQLNVAIVLEPETVYLQEHPEIGLSAYDLHVDGSGVRHSSRLRPILNHGPCSDLWNFNADTHLLAWLARMGQAVDVITDEDLHAEGVALLERYRVVLTGTHPEYWSTPMFSALQGYLQQGGRLMYLGGNGFYWRIAFHPALPGVIEIRRAEGGARYWEEAPGEYHHAFSGELGGLWRRVGLPPEQVVGVGTRGIGFERSAPYHRTAASRDPRVAFMFEGLADAAPIGDTGYVAGGAAGFEIDASSAERGTPAHALIVAVADEFPASTMPVPEDILMCAPAMSGDLNRDIRAELVFFETPGGGAVFSVGSIAWCASLPWNGCDNPVARLTGNVLRRFLSGEPFPAPFAGASDS